MDNVEKLIAGLKSADAQTRLDAAIELGNLKDSRAIDPLKEALQDKHEFVRVQAKEALRKIGDAGTTVSFTGSSNTQRVVIVNFDMPFWDLVMFMVKFAIASIPATIILFLIFAVLYGLFGGLLVALVSRR